MRVPESPGRFRWPLAGNRAVAKFRRCPTLAALRRHSPRCTLGPQVERGSEPGPRCDSPVEMPSSVDDRRHGDPRRASGRAVRRQRASDCVLRILSPGGLHDRRYHRCLDASRVSGTVRRAGDPDRTGLFDRPRQHSGQHRARYRCNCRQSCRSAIAARRLLRGEAVGSGGIQYR